MKKQITKKAEDEIDKEVITDADDDTKWEEAINVKPTLNATTLFLSKTMIEKAKKIAKRNNKEYQLWLKEIVEEKILHENI